jgi:predicted molibdopterin-dependent oxidoreductase YjgC
VPAQDLIDFAMKFGQSKSTLIATGMGLSQQITGTHNVLALINLCLITGQIGKEGSGINPPRGQNNVQGATCVGASPIYYPGYISVLNEVNRKKVAKIWEVDVDQLSATPGLTTVEIVQAAYDQKIKGMYIMGENPIITDPNINHTIEALKKLEFLVVQDLFLTETAHYAHVIFPAASFAEKNGTFVTSDRRVVRVRKSVDIPGEAKEDWKTIVSLAEKMAQPMKRYADESEIFDEITKVTPIFGGITYNRIEHEGIQWPCPTKDPPGTSTLFLDKFNTSSGKAIITPVEYVPPSENVDAEFPFLLNTGRILYQYHYQYHSCTMSRKSQILTKYSNNSYVMMNPVDVEKFGFSEGESVKVSSKRGFLKTQIRSSNQVSPGELFIPFHYSESPVNMLTWDVLDPHSKMPPFKLSACKVEKI